MLTALDDTIAAVASPPGSAERGIVRVGGPDVRSVVGSVLEPDDPDRWRTARLPMRHPGRIRVAGGVDLAVAVHLWPTDRSYTGQPLAEIHTLGVPPLLDLVVSRLCDHGARPARRGEFTLRSFLAGRLDLVRAEAVLGVIDADDHVELKRALAQLAGGVSSRMQLVRSDLLELLADLEAGLDFVDEDIEFVPASEVVRRLGEAERFVADLLERTAGRSTSTGRPVVVLAGLPNAGKSTLFNRLAGDAGSALVSDVAGTTRDWLVAEADLDGLVVELVDTAGWERTTAEIDAEAARLRDEQLARADLVVWCTPPDLVDDDRETDATVRGDVTVARLHVGTKRDLGETADVDLTVNETDALGELTSAIRRRLAETNGDRGELLATTSARARDSLTGAREALERARTTAESGDGDELVSLETRHAIDELGTILGDVYTDDVLDRVFSKFCIGK